MVQYLHVEQCPGTHRVAGFKSEFLVLGTFDPDGTLRLLGVEEGAPPGAPIA